MSFSRSEQEIIKAVKQRQIFLQVLGKGVGIVSLLAIIAFTSRAIEKRLADKARLKETALAYETGPFNPTSKDKVGSPQANSPTRVQSHVVDMTSRSDRSGEPTKVSVVDLSKPIGTRSASEETVPAKEVTGIQNIEEKKPRIAEVVRDFFLAKSLSELLPVVRDPRRVKPLMEEYYQRNPFAASKWKGIGWAIPVEEKGFRFAYVQALFDDAPPVNVVIEETERGSFELDWESAVHYCELSWKDFMANRPEAPKMFRVIASRVDAAEMNVRGSNGKETTLKLKHPQEEGVVYGKFDPNDPNFRPLLRQLDLCEWKDVPVILRLCYPGPSSEGTASVQIAGVEGKGWLILDDLPRS